MTTFDLDPDDLCFVKVMHRRLHLWDSFALAFLLHLFRLAVQQETVPLAKLKILGQSPPNRLGILGTERMECPDVGHVCLFDGAVRLPQGPALPFPSLA